MPTTDWNWFFSSVAQSAAAIVGIFGAFIVTKILANQSAYAEKSRRIQELITLGEKLVDATNRLSFEWYHKHDSAREIEDLEKLLEKHRFLIYELLTPDDIQRDVIDKAGADLKAFEHVNYCLAVRKA